VNVHELSVAAQLIRLVEEHARRAGAQRVLAVHLALGEHSHLVGDALRWHFERLAAGGLVAGASLHIRRISMRFRCDDCSADYTPGVEDWRCPQCGRVGRLLDAGDELLIESIEVKV
jgi:hydrogenase nickel incorporation protein HypA/HybF